MPNNKVAKIKSIEEIRKSVSNSIIGFDSNYILKLADEETKGLKGPKEFAPETNYYKAMTLFEFDKGVLLASSMPEKFRVFALEFSRNIQTEYNCTTQSEKSMAEVIALNYVRVLSVQDRVNSYLSMGSITDMGIRYLAVLSKELDRAERHYLTSLQALNMLKSPALEVNIRTQTAVVGQNQIVQSNNNDKPI